MWRFAPPRVDSPAKHHVLEASPALTGAEFIVFLNTAGP